MTRERADLVGLMAEAYRLRLLRGLEALFEHTGARWIAGVDEAGRGCLAGPVVAAAVVVDRFRLVAGVDDSKRVEAARRVHLAERVRATAVDWAWSAVPAATVDRINVLEATRLAMRRALDRLRVRPDCVLVDAVPLRWQRAPCVPLIRGDSFSYAVASASLVAKAERDRLMGALDGRYPGYGFASHKGYAARSHRRAIERLGPTPIHRLTFRSVVPRIDDRTIPSTDCEEVA